MLHADDGAVRSTAACRSSHFCIRGAKPVHAMHRSAHTCPDAIGGQRRSACGQCIGQRFSQLHMSQRAPVLIAALDAGGAWASNLARRSTDVSPLSGGMGY